MRPEQGDAKDMQPRPFLQPAFERVAPKVQSVVQEFVERKLAKERERPVFPVKRSKP